MYDWTRCRDLEGLRVIRLGTYSRRMSISFKASFLFLVTEKLWKVSSRN